MSELVLPAEGGCRCGRLRVRIDAPPLMASACHCTGCQRMTGSAFSLTATVPEEGFAVLTGDPVIGGLHGEDAQHFHCPHCLSWVFTRAPALAGFVNLRATMLDDTGWFAPFIETYLSERLPWAETPARHSYDAFPPVEHYAKLAAEYAATLTTRRT